MASEGLIYLVGLKGKETAKIGIMKSFSPFEDLNFKRCYLKVIAHIFLFNICINWFSLLIKLIYIKMMLFHWFHTSPWDV